MRLVGLSSVIVVVVVSTTLQLLSAADVNTTSSYNQTANSTANSTADVSAGGSYADWQVALIVVACGILVVGTIVGNLLVVIAVAVVRRLRTPSNLLIVSLAIADLLVAVLDMPFAAMYEAMMGRWVLGQTVCDVWTSLDVLLCTASILNLCAISVDRYFVITRPFQYAMKRTPARMAAMIAAVWILSAVISIPPLFGWKDERKPGECIVSQHIGYQFYATIGAFYLPLTIMIVIYVRIYLVSARIARAEAMSKPSMETAAANDQRMSLTQSTLSAETAVRRDSGPPTQSQTMLSVASSSQNEDATCNGRTTPAATKWSESDGNGASTKRSRAFSVAEFVPAIRRRSVMFVNKTRVGKVSSSNERKATKTLGVIMGAFTACWLPFFIIALIKPFCYDQETCIPQWLSSLFLWLGYANSLLNPIIYARFNRDFRTPFKHILQCHIRDINVRLRSENYTEQYGGMTFGPRPSVAAADWLQQPRGSATSAADVIVRVQCPPNRTTRVTDTM